MKNIDELKKYYFEHKSNFEKSNVYYEQNENLNKFRNEYPIEKFNQLSLNEYTLGMDNKESLCYQMEFGKYKHIGPGIGGSTAFKYGIYYSKDKNSYVTRTGIVVDPEETWQNIRDDLSKVFYSISKANSVLDIKDDYSSLKGMPMYIIKLAFCYYPEKLICISGRKQLKGVLDLFDIEYDESYSSLQLAFLINKIIRNNIPELADDSPITFGHLIWDFYYINSDSAERERKELEKKTWIYAPGENANKWDEFYKEGIMALNWDSLGDLRQYASKSEIKETLLNDGNSSSSRKNDILANWEFVNVLKIGDIIYAKKGTNTIIGKGIVESDYIFDDNRPEYKSYRKVNWIFNEEKDHTEYAGHTMVQKTLTDISKYPDYVEKLEKVYETNNNEQRFNEYTKFDFLKEVLITEEKYDNIINTLERKKNIILQGAPGVGKTFCAKKIMYSLMNYKDESRIKTVQFHQSYSYEDFIQGYRPNDKGNFEIKNGVFYDLVQEARKEYERAIANDEEPKKYCMIIDEINRGNLSKVFGELMMLIESDKRDQKWSINLTYSDDDFYIPSNLYIIGTMNTADRSLATIDYALRRRFAFINLEPAFENDEACDKFRNYLVNQEKIEVSFVERIITAYKKLNNYIVQSLSKDFMIGHSYFINQFNNDEDNEDVYKSIVDYEIVPLLDEYFYDDKEKVEEAKKIIEKI